MKQYSLVLMLVWLALVSFGQNRLPEVPKSQGYTDLSIQERGFWHAIEANLESSIILEKDNTQRTGLMYTAGYRFSEFLKLPVPIINDFLKCFEVLLF